MIVNPLRPHFKRIVWAAILCASPVLSLAQGPEPEWTESQVIERFLTMSPDSRELRARVALAEAEARTRTVYPNPSVSYSQEGAGYNAFFEASQTLPVSGRIRYLREAGAAAVSVADTNREWVLWSLRSDLRAAFYRMIAAQERLRILASGISEVEQLVRILRQREEEGEGSRYDRLRAERELGELRTDLATVRPLLAATTARLNVYLPEDTEIRRVRGDLRVPPETPELNELIRRAMNARADYRVQQKEVARYEIEEQAARRLRIPEPNVSGGVKRADVLSGAGADPFSNVTRTGVAFGVSVPLPVFNNGRYEVAQYQAKQEQIKARSAVLARQIHAEVQGAREVLTARREALSGYQREIEASGGELTRITQVAYDEGEIGILELLDSFRISRTARLRVLDLETGVKEALIELERVVGEELSNQEVRP